MPKNSWTDYSTTAASNTDVHSVSIAEGMAPSDVNNAMRELMADTANFDQGNVTLTSALAVASGGTGAATHTANNVLVGAGTSAVTSVAPSTSGNVLTSNGTVWASSASPATDLTAVADGSVGSPSIANSGDTNTGIYWPGADQLGLTTAGAAAMLIDATGAVTKPLQPAFMAIANAQTNVTGDGTAATLTWTTEAFDQNADFDGTSTFTAPITGRYLIGASVDVRGLAAANNLCIINLITSNRTFSIINLDMGNIMSGGNALVIGLGGTVVADFDAADTATVVLDIRGGSQVVDTSTGGYFYACLLA